jgi:hypothetical protein
MRNWSTKARVAAIAAVLAIGATALVGAGAALGQSAKSAAESSAKADATYTWSAELVAFDAPTNTLTVKAMMVSNPEANDVPELRAGDRAMLTWSGLSTAAGVRAIERGNSSSFDRMTMPIEFVASELDGRYVSFKVTIPSKDSAAIAGLKPGAYVTATSPLRAKSAAEAVVSIKPYVNNAS